MRENAGAAGHIGDVRHAGLVQLPADDFAGAALFVPQLGVSMKIVSNGHEVSQLFVNDGLVASTRWEGTNCKAEPAELANGFFSGP